MKISQVCGAALLGWVAFCHADVRLLTGDSNNNLHNADGLITDISSDGSLILFASGPPVSGSTPGITRGGLYLRDLANDTLEFVGVPVGGEANNNPTDGVESSMSDDGRFITWRNSGSPSKIFWRDHQSGETRSVTPNANGNSLRPVISADGRYVAFISVARNLVADTTLLPPSGATVFVYDSLGETIEVASLAHNGAAMTSGVGFSAVANEFDFSADGNWIVFSTAASNVHPDRSMAVSQAYFWTYRRNIHTGQVDIVSKNAMNQYPTGNMTTPRTDATGNRILFAGGFVGIGGGPVLIPGKAASFSADLYVKDMTSGEVILISKTTDDSANSAAFSGHAINGNGTVVAFGSDGNKFVAAHSDSNQSGDSLDIFRADINGSSQVTITQSTLAVFGSDNVGFFNGPFLPGTGDYVAFNTRYFMRLLGEPDRAGVNQGVGVGAFNFQSPALPYETWNAGLPANQQGLDQTPTSSSTNLEKFIYGAEATSTTLDHMPVEGKATGVSLGLTGDMNEYLTFTVRVRRDLPTGFGWTVKVADSVTGIAGSGVMPVVVGAPVADGDVDIYTFRMPTPINGNPTGFIAIELEGTFGIGT